MQGETDSFSVLCDSDGADLAVPARQRQDKALSSDWMVVIHWLDGKVHLAAYIVKCFFFLINLCSPLACLSDEQTDESADASSGGRGQQICGVGSAF